MVGEILMGVVVLLLIPATPEAENPWREKVGPAAARAEKAQSISAYREAIEIAWKADDWRRGVELAEAALERHPRVEELKGLAARALWRAGRLKQAEAMIAELPRPTKDAAALATMVTAHLARGEVRSAGEAAEALAKLDQPGASELVAVLNYRMQVNQLDGMARLVRRLQRVVDPKNGYPETFIHESVEGLAEFYAAIGREPLNQIEHYGEAPMPAIAVINLPSVDVMINGKGPYRVILDTGGSITLSLDTSVAEEIGLESVAQAKVRGVGGLDTSGQAVIEKLELGSIGLRRVMTRIFGVRAASAGTVDGILGTGVFASGRFAMDFGQGVLRVEPSSEAAGAGEPVELRVVGDSKLLAPVVMNGRPIVALLDSGADALAASPQRLREIFPDKPIKSLPVAGMGVGQGGEAELMLTPGIDFSLGARRFENVGGLGLDVLDNILSPALGVQIDLLIGMPVFREMRTFTVDLPRCRMWVQWIES